MHFIQNIQTLFRIVWVTLLVLPLHAGYNVRRDPFTAITHDLHAHIHRACKIRFATCGGVTHWALTDDDDGGVMTVAWGQNAMNGRWPFASPCFK